MCRGLAREGPAEEDSAPARARRRIEKGVVGMLDLGAATAAARAALGLLLEHAPSSPPVPRGEALAAAREEAARLLCVSGALDDAAAASTPCSTAATATDPSPPGEQMTLPPLAGHGGPSDSVASKRAAAAAAFAQSLQKTKKPRWGGSNELAVRESVQGSADKDAEAAKLRQALTVSELSTKLSAFRKDRGVAEVPSSTRLSIKVPLPEADASGRERNWVGILIGREGINKKRFEQQTGSTIALRGKGAMLRSQKKDDDTLEPLHVVLEADTQEALDYARVQLNKLAMAKTTSTEECAFCGKEGHHHSVCPKRKTKFTMSGVVCSACGCGGHTIRDCKADRSQVVKLHPGGNAPSVLEDADYAAFMSELSKRGGSS